jgi:hypothetical protein
MSAFDPLRTLDGLGLDLNSKDTVDELMRARVRDPRRI